MNAFHAWPNILIVELVGALVFLWIFFKFIGKFSDATSFVQKNLWKFALAGFIVMAFISINTVMFRMEARRGEEAARTMAAFNDSKAHIEIIGIGSNKSGVFTYETDKRTIHFFVRDLSTEEVAPCYIKRENVFVYVNDFVEKPFIIFNSTGNTIDLHFPGNAIEVKVEELIKEEFDFDQLASDALPSFLTSLDMLEE
jgi:hypothetical protein